MITKMQSLFSIFLVCCCSWQIVVCTKTNEETLSDEDDDILAHFSPTSKTKRQFVQQNVKSLGETISIPPTRRNYKSDAASIVGDVNKYGLWEYTSDNTGMGDQIKQLMSRADTVDIDGETNAHSLENEAHKMNEQINKYAEASSEPSPTIDPLEQPQEMDQSQSQKLLENEAPNEQKFYDHGESVSVVSIPSTLTIEDEHGHHLDTVNVGTPSNSSLVTSTPLGDDSKHHDNSFEKTVEATLAKLRSNSSLPAKKTEQVKPSEQEDSLTFRLLNAMRKSDTFRKKAEELLPSSSDNDIQLFQKEKQIYNNLKMIENEEPSKSESSKVQQSTVESKLHIPQYHKQEKGSDGKLLTSIKQLIHDDYSSHDEEQNVLKDLLSTMKKAEKDEGKIETDFSDMGGGSTGETLSDAYLAHFKEFLQKHKQKEHAKDEHGETNSAVDDGGSKESGHALMDFLQKEASSFNKFHEPNKNPKEELQRMEAMINKQESQEEPLDKQNEKLLHKQMKELVEDRKHDEKALNRIKAHNGENKDKVSVGKTKTTPKNHTGVSDEEVEVFDNSILKYIQKSQRFRQYLQGKGILPASETSEIRTHTSSSSASMDDGVMNLFERPLAQQFEEIELQKEILNLKERQLRNRDRNKVFEKKKKDARDKEISIAKSNHMLHLTNPEREKFSQESGKQMTEIKDVMKADQTLKKKKLLIGHAEEVLLNGHAEEVLKNKGLSLKLAKVDKEKDEPLTNLTLTGESDHSAVQSIVADFQEDDKETVESLAEKLEEKIGKLNTSQEKKQDVEVTDDGDDTASDEHGFTKKTTDSSSIADKEKPKKSFQNKNLTFDREAMLVLPINNPKPEAEATLTPHADFHSSPTMNVIKPQSNVAVRHLSPVKAAPTTVERRQFEHKPTPSSKSFKELHQIPGHASETHHDYPILEPTTTTNQFIKNRDIQPNEIMQPAHAPDSQPSNLLKHKEIPLPLEKIDKKQITMFVHSVTDKHPRFIRPKMARIVDKTAVKKGFGKLPAKPKKYLLKELERDISLLDKHSKIANKTVSKKNKLIKTPANSDTLRNSTNSNHVLVPSKRAQKTNLTQSNDSKTERRSNVQVEDVFNILQSEDQKDLSEKTT